MKNKAFSLKIGIIVLTLALAMLPRAAHTENGQVISGKSSEGAVDLASKKVTIRPCSEGRETIFEGNVKAKQRDITLFCDRLIIISDENKGSTSPESRTKKLSRDLQINSDVKTITALGNVKITQKDRIVTAGKAIYDHAKRTVTLTEGPPGFWEGRNSGTADAVIMYLDENRFELFKPDFTIKPGEQKKENKK